MLSVCLLGCGARVGSSSGEDDSNTETDEPVRRWRWGGDATPVVSSPARANDGVLHVLVGVDAVLLPVEEQSVNAHYQAAGLALASLSPAGELRWLTTVIDRELELADHVLSPPAVGEGGDVWVCYGSSLTRVRAEGAIAWTG